jgi:hypothetical protein
VILFIGGQRKNQVCEEEGQKILCSLTFGQHLEHECTVHKFSQITSILNPTCKKEEGKKRKKKATHKKKSQLWLRITVLTKKKTTKMHSKKNENLASI